VAKSTGNGKQSQFGGRPAIADWGFGIGDLWRPLVYHGDTENTEVDVSGFQNKSYTKFSVSSAALWRRAPETENKANSPGAGWLREIRNPNLETRNKLEMRMIETTGNGKQSQCGPGGRFTTETPRARRLNINVFLLKGYAFFSASSASLWWTARRGRGIPNKANSPGARGAREIRSTKLEMRMIETTGNGKQSQCGSAAGSPRRHRGHGG